MDPVLQKSNKHPPIQNKLPFNNNYCMDYALIIAIMALLLSGFALYRGSTSARILAARIERLKDKNSILEHKLTEYKGVVNRNNANRSSRQSAANEPVAITKEPVPQRQQPSQQRQQNQQRQQPNEQRQQPAQQVNPQQQQPKKKKENRRRNEAMEKQNHEPEKPRKEEQLNQNEESLEMLLEKDRMIEFEPVEQESALPPEQQAETYTERKYAIIPEDGIIRQHQLQVQPDSDSYLEVDMPAYGKSNMTRYRFNMGGNHAFVIAQGIDRLENAFSFAKPSNRKVSQVVHQEDGVLEKTDNGWRIYEKAKIDFR